MAAIIFLVKEMGSKTFALAWVYTAKGRLDSRAVEWSCGAAEPVLVALKLDGIDDVSCKKCMESPRALLGKTASASLWLAALA